MTQRSLHQQAFIRVCRDSGFQMDAIEAAKLAAATLGVSALEIWIALGDLSTMHRIAAKEHPALHSKVKS